MANQSTETNHPSNMQTYGVPIYAAEWIPELAVRSKIAKDQENSDDGESSSSSGSYIVLSGGGGEGRSGIPNVILICRVDLDSNSLSEQPIGRLVVGTDIPYRMAVHPREGGLICAFPNSCRLFDWENIMSPREYDHVSEESEEVIQELNDVGQQLSLVFNQEGSVLATGAEDGTLRVFEWPSMKTLLNESQAHSSVKSLTFSESVSWKTKKQKTVARSSTEAEYMSMALAFCELIWTKAILGCLGVTQSAPMFMFCDNKSALNIAANPVLHERTKHIEIDCHFVRDRVQDGTIIPHYIHTNEQMADILTKSLCTRQFQFLLCKRGIRDLHAPS